jgi:hypothetical protein
MKYEVSKQCTVNIMLLASEFDEVCRDGWMMMMMNEEDKEGKKRRKIRSEEMRGFCCEQAG